MRKVSRIRTDSSGSPGRLRPALSAVLSGESSALRRRPRRFPRDRARHGGRWVPEGAGCPSAPPPAGCSSRTGRCLMLSHNRVQCSLPTGRRGLWPLMVIRAVFTRSNAMSAAELRPACTQGRGAVEFHIPSIGFRTCLRCGRSWSLSVVISHTLADERLPGCPSCSNPRDLLPHPRARETGAPGSQRAPLSTTG